MMNDTTKEYNRKNTYTNNAVCNTLRLEVSCKFATLNSRGGGFWWIVLLGRYSLGRGCQIYRPCKFKCKTFHMQKFSHATHSFSLSIFSDLSWMRLLLLYSILRSYFTSKIFHFFFQQIKAILCRT